MFTLQSIKVKFIHSVYRDTDDCMVSSKITLFWHSRGHSIGHIVYGIMCSHVYTTGAGVVNLNCSETGGSGAFPKGLQDVILRVISYVRLYLWS